MNFLESMDAKIYDIDISYMRGIHIVIKLNTHINLITEGYNIMLSDIQGCANNHNVVLEKVAIELKPYTHFHILAKYQCNISEAYDYMEQFKRVCGRKIQQLMNVKMRKTFEYVKVNPIHTQVHWNNTYNYICRKEDEYSTNII